MCGRCALWLGRDALRVEDVRYSRTKNKSRILQGCLQKTGAAAVEFVEPGGVIRFSSKARYALVQHGVGNFVYIGAPSVVEEFFAGGASATSSSQRRETDEKQTVIEFPGAVWPDAAPARGFRKQREQEYDGARRREEWQ